MQPAGTGRRKAAWYYVIMAIGGIALGGIWSSHLAKSRAMHESPASIESVLENFVAEEVRMDVLLDGGSSPVELIEEDR